MENRQNILGVVLPEVEEIHFTQGNPIEALLSEILAMYLDKEAKTSS